MSKDDDNGEGEPERRRRRSGPVTKGGDARSAKQFRTRVKTARGRKYSSKLWLERQLNDPYVARAKQEGYRSRAAYKLIELDDKFGLIKPGMRVADLGAAPHLLVCDASYISLEKVLARPLELLAEGGEMIVLFKPQFEVGPNHVGKGGLVKDEGAVERAKENARAFFARASIPVKGETGSPIRGGDGNREYLFYGRQSGSDQ